MTKEALTLALEALEYPLNISHEGFNVDMAELLAHRAITAIKEALAQQSNISELKEKTANHNVDCLCADCLMLDDLEDATAQPEQEPVAMKFKIYKPTVPDPTRQDINNALLPWVYDQDRSSGFDASMWVTPVSTLPPQRTWVELPVVTLPLEIK